VVGELFNRVWPDQIVEESNLTVQVSAIRKALGEQTSNPKYLFTMLGHGYRFNGQILRTADDDLVIEHHSVSVVEVSSTSNSAVETATVRHSASQSARLARCLREAGSLPVLPLQFSGPRLCWS
jgi:DNA-binding winged helix-turn-helix (wHTH) protein